MIYYKGGAKMMNPVLSREEYLAIRNGGEQRRDLQGGRIGQALGAVRFVFDHVQAVRGDPARGHQVFAVILQAVQPRGEDHGGVGEIQLPVPLAIIMIDRDPVGLVVVAQNGENAARLLFQNPDTFRF